MPLSPSDELLRRMLDIADHYARQGETYQLDRLRLTAREYADALVQLQRALHERERLLAAIAAVDDRFAVDMDVPAAFRRAL